jgi:hypothetical protein
MNTWKHIFTVKKRALDIINTKNINSEKAELIDKLTKELEKYPLSMVFPRILINQVNNKKDIQTLKNMWHYLTCEANEEGFYLKSPTEINNWHKGFLNIRVNKLSGDYEINGWTPNLMDNTDNNKVYTSIVSQLKSQRTLSKHGLPKTIQTDIESYFSSGLIEYFNPVKEYFDNLQKETGREEIKKVIKIINECSENNSGLFFVDWCLGLIKNALGNNYYDRILYLYSALGGDGKTYFIQNDLIPELKQYITTDFSFNAENKDDKFKLAENIIAIDDEGSSTSRKSDNAKKSISSKLKISERQAYDKKKISQKRIASLVVCLNNDDISSASNFDRRSLVIALNSVNWKNQKSFVSRWRNEVNINKFWAELYNIWKKDTDFFFVEDNDILEETQNWKQQNDDTDLIDIYLRKPSKNDKYVILSHVRIKKVLESKSGQNIKSSINGYLKAKGFKNVRKQKCPTTGAFTSGYCVIIAADVYFEEEPSVDSILDKILNNERLTDLENKILKKKSKN